MDFKIALQNNNKYQIINHIKNGINLNKLIDYKYPIFYLIQNDNIELIELFFSYGAKINIYSCECSMTPIMYAIQLKKDKIIQLLISYGSNLNFILKDYYTEGLGVYFHSLTLNTNIIFWAYETNPFLSAYICGHINAVKYILNNQLFDVKKEYFSYFNEYEINENRKKIKYMLKESLKIWSPGRHYLIPNIKKKYIKFIFNLKYKKDMKYKKDIKYKNDFYLPNELWFKICTFI